MKRDDSIYLQHVQDAITKIETYLTGVDETTFHTQSLIQDGVIRQLEIIGEEEQPMNFTLRKARLDDRSAIEQLIVESARGLSRDDYDDEQIEAAIAAVFGVDTDLIVDGTYFVAEHAGTVIGCGGWSRRKTLFGGDRYAERDAGLLDPSTDPAKIRAFFVHPSWARKGVGSALLDVCEAEARAHGFHTLELMATLPGVKLYQARGYVGSERIHYELGPQTSIEFVPMCKTVL